MAVSETIEDVRRETLFCLRANGRRQVLASGSDEEILWREEKEGRNREKKKGLRWENNSDTHMPTNVRTNTKKDNKRKMKRERGQPLSWKRWQNPPKFFSGFSSHTSGSHHMIWRERKWKGQSKRGRVLTFGINKKSPTKPSASLRVQTLLSALSPPPH